MHLGEFKRLNKPSVKNSYYKIRIYIMYPSYQEFTLCKFISAHSLRDNYQQMLQTLYIVSIFIINLWLHLRKAGFHAHNSKTHFSPANDSCIHWLTIQVGIDAESWPGYFCCGLLLRPVRRPQVYGSPSNGCISPWQADSQLYFTTWLANEFGHWFSCFVWYVVEKMAPMDAIWLVLVNT